MRKSRHIKSLLFIPIAALTIFGIETMIPSTSVADTTVSAVTTSTTIPVVAKLKLVRTLSQQRAIITHNNQVQWLTVAEQQAQAKAAAEARYEAEQRAYAQQQAQAETTTTVAAPSDSSLVISGGGSGTFAQLAICEEGGNNSPTYGYFGIMPNSWPAGYGPQDSEAEQEQAVLIINHGSIPYAPVGCVTAGYGGW